MVLRKDKVTHCHVISVIQLLTLMIFGGTLNTAIHRILRRVNTHIITLYKSTILLTYLSVGDLRKPEVGGRACATTIHHYVIMKSVRTFGIFIGEHIRPWCWLASDDRRRR